MSTHIAGNNSKVASTEVSRVTKRNIANVPNVVISEPLQKESRTSIETNFLNSDSCSISEDSEAEAIAKAKARKVSNVAVQYLTAKQEAEVASAARKSVQNLPCRIVDLKQCDLDHKLCAYCLQQFYLDSGIEISTLLGSVIKEDTGFVCKKCQFSEEK